MARHSASEFGTTMVQWPTGPRRWLACAGISNDGRFGKRGSFAPAMGEDVETSSFVLGNWS